MFGKCKPSKRLDLSKIDSTCFVGSYTCNFEDKTERFVLKADGIYDYYWQPENIKIENAGKWFFRKRNEGEIVLTDFPNYRKVIFEKEDKTYRYLLNLSIDKTFEIIRGGSEEYIFKPDNRKKVE